LVSLPIVTPNTTRLGKPSLFSVRVSDRVLVAVFIGPLANFEFRIVCRKMTSPLLLEQFNDNPLLDRFGS